MTHPPEDRSLTTPEHTRETSGEHTGRWRTLLALSFGYFVDQGEGQAMSTLFPAIRDALNFGYGGLGRIAGWRNLLQAISAPFWGFLSDRISRKWIIVFGTGLWGLWTLACGFAMSYTQLFWIRIIAGLGLGCLLPPTFSIISDLFGPEERGRANGLLGSIGFVGVIISVLTLGWLVEAPGFGWRWGFFFLGGASVLSGVVIALFVKEPPRGAAEPELAGVITEASAQRFRIKPADLKEILAIPTMWVTFLQGIFGVTPWVVMGAYLVTWLVDERGIPQGRAPMVFAVIIVGQAVAQTVGGLIADWMHKRYPNSGRIIVSQFSIFNGVWMTVVLFSVPLGFVPLMIVALLMGCMIGWAGKGGRDPILQAVLRPELRGTAWAITAAIEGGLSALSAFLAGWLAETYGLTAMMLVCVPLSWFVLFLCWFGYYKTYPADAARLRDAMTRRRQALEEAA
ncbi:MAG: MFS transporter [Anaerolineae bacterium]|nr:MFS transporter [Anaerolineae bacterium]